MLAADYDFSKAVDYHYGRFPPANIDFQRVLDPVSRAATALARYDTILQTLHKSDLLLAPLRRREAVISSRIEGTVATLDEVMELEAEEDDDDIGEPVQRHSSEAVEVLAYTRALYQAQREMADGLPISGRIIRSAHKRLLSTGRGSEKRPGEFKEDQNYIVDKTTKKVLFVPADPLRFPDLFGRLEAYINDDNLNPLLQAAISHVEFEALHPFKDGNGRVGRMLVTLMLWSRGLISSPHFYVSGQFEAMKDEYIDRMRYVSERNEWTEWCIFFLQALSVQAEENINTAQNITGLYNEMKRTFAEVTRSRWATTALDYIFSKAIFRNSAFVHDAGIPPQTAHRITNALAERGILTQLRSPAGRRSALFAFEPLLKLVRPKP